MHWQFVILVVGSCSVYQCLSQNPCIGQDSCGTCIATDKRCAWCQDPDYDLDNKERCNLLTEHGDCTEEHIVAPDSELNRTQDEEPRDGSGTDTPVQIQPQVINLKLRPNDPQRFNLTFRVANNYPVDLYYLMDYSYSMKDDRDELASLAVLLEQRMRNLTEDFRVGFGTFVDKEVMPFAKRSEKLCETCEPAYSFKNHLKLQRDPNLFKQSVLNSNISGSMDAPEGGMDALMQTMVCENEIAWRDLSRRMIMYATDAAFHFAGDGKLGGIILPNDGLCHLNNNGEYDHGTKQDYPSVSQIAAKVAEKSINAIFAVTDRQTENYEQLQMFILGSETGLLTNNSSNVIDIITTIYQKLTSKVELVTNNAKDVVIRYFAKCLDMDGELKETNVCKNLKIGDSVTFEIEIEVNECPEDTSSYSRRIDIKPVGLVDKLEVRLELACKCDCENQENIATGTRTSEYCNNHGAFVCGTCECDDRYFGKTCLCFTGNTTNTDLQSQCKAPGDSQVCSGRGDCLCGQCDCNSNRGNKYTGQFCECDDFSCPFYNNLLCGGLEHGTCACGLCNCTGNFTGENCQCSTATDKCVDSIGGLCGGPEKGSCECNKCKCKERSNYRGPTCEDCIGCELVCNQHRDCVECVAYGTGELKDNCGDCRAKNYIEIKDELSSEESSCEYKDGKDCIFYFTYRYTEDDLLKITAKRNKECPEVVNVLHVILGVIFGIVGIGIGLLIVWRIYASIQDAREFHRLQREAEDAQFDSGENPLYKPATTSYQNPAFSS